MNARANNRRSYTNTQANSSPKLEGRLLPCTGRHNQQLKELRLAFRRAELNARGECAIEGIKLLEEALRSGRQVTTVFFSESVRPLAEKLLPQIGSRTEILLVPGALFKSIVPSENPQGVAALVKVPNSSSQTILERASSLPLLVAAGLQDPGNLGAIFRSAEAFGAAGIFLTEGTVTPYNWKALRGSAGSIFRLPFAQLNSRDLIALLRAQGVRMLATTAHGGISLPDVSWSLPVAVFIGNDGAGLRREILHQMDGTIAVPQSAQVESLNAAIAASIVLYEAGKAGQKQGSRSPIEDAKRHR
jgi:RNA methyltransferase, TrmH family